MLSRSCCVDPRWTLGKKRPPFVYFSPPLLSFFLVDALRPFCFSNVPRKFASEPSRRTHSEFKIAKTPSRGFSNDAKRAELSWKVRSPTGTPSRWYSAVAASKTCLLNSRKSRSFA